MSLREVNIMNNEKTSVPEPMSDEELEEFFKSFTER